MSEYDNEYNENTAMPRRSVLKGAGVAVGGSLLASAAQAQPAAAPVPQVGNPSTPAYNPATEYVFTIYATISDAMTVGPTTRGQIRAIPITGGEVEGENIRGRVVPGGADWQRARADGITEIEATYAIELEDKTLVKVVNRGIIDAQSTPEGRYFRTAVRFEAPQGPHQWLNEAIFLCKADRHPTRAQTVQVEVFKLV
jgi:Protein of unknown function (DUF3237)